MKKLIIPLFILGLTQITLAQDKGFSIGLGGSFDKRVNEYSEYPSSSIKHEFSNISEFSFGLQVNYKFNDKIGLRSGISYSRKGYMLTYAWVTSDGDNGTGDPAIPLETQFRLNYLDLPLGIYYQVVNSNRYTFSPSLGIMNSINIGESEVSKMGDGARKETTYESYSYNSFLLGTRLGFINNFNLSDNIFISLEPYVMYNLYRLNDTNIEKSDFTFGGYFSVNYTFNKK